MINKTFKLIVAILAGAFSYFAMIVFTFGIFQVDSLYGFIASKTISSGIAFFIGYIVWKQLTSETGTR